MDKQPLVIEQRIRDMMQYGHIALRQFPKSEKHVLAAEIRTSMLTLLRLVITAAKRYHKKTTLTDLDVELAVLQNQIRLANGTTARRTNTTTASCESSSTATPNTAGSRAGTRGVPHRACTAAWLMTTTLGGGYDDDGQARAAEAACAMAGARLPQ